MPFGYICIPWNSASTTVNHPLDGTQLVVSADRLPVFQRKNTDRIWCSCYAVLDYQFCNSWTVVAVWIPGSRANESKVMH